jgi:peptidoglycan/LPS O-acetylase OafA/YrhL
LNFRHQRLSLLLSGSVLFVLYKTTTFADQNTAICSKRCNILHLKDRVFFSGLNGLRAIASLAVVFSHTTQGLSAFGLDSFVFGASATGEVTATLLAGFGVSMFFTLSGFLITYLLLEEKELGEVNIKNFYIRRILRIWPLYYLYLLLAIITLIVFNVKFQKTSILLYLLLSANVPFIINQALPFLAHYWSLGVEEQFYSFWPWMVKRSKSLLATTVLLCAGLMIFKIAIHLVDLRMHNANTQLLYSTIHVTRFHCMLIGAIGAILYRQQNVLFIKLTNNYFAQFLSWAIICLVAINKFHVASFIDNELISIVSVFLIIGQIQKERRIVNLNVGAADFIGKISYGIYVMHPLMIFYLAQVINFSNAQNVFSYVLVYGAVFTSTILISYLSYYFFEHRFLILKEKYSTVKTAAAIDYSQ